MASCAETGEVEGEREERQDSRYQGACVSVRAHTLSLTDTHTHAYDRNQGWVVLGPWRAALGRSGGENKIQDTKSG